MNSTKRRLWLYGAGTVVLGALVWAGFVRKGEADVGTLLGSLDVQLRLAAGMPATDQQGKPVAARVELVANANQLLAELERREPHSAQVWEYRGFVAYLEGRFLDAANIYGEAQTFADCDDELRTSLHRNQVRMLLAAGHRAEALAALQARPGAPSCELGFLHQEAGDSVGAVRIYEAAAASEPMANYELARLRLANGDADGALTGLERAAEADAAGVRTRLLRHPDTWPGLPANPRWQRLIAEPGEPGR